MQRVDRGRPGACGPPAPSPRVQGCGIRDRRDVPGLRWLHLLPRTEGTQAQLGVIPKGLQAEATCSHAYVKGGTHNWAEADGVMIFNRSVLPGYSALFRHLQRRHVPG